MFGHVGHCWRLINLSGGIFRAGARTMPPVILILGKRRSRVTPRPSTEVRRGCSADPHRNRLTSKAPPANYAPPSITAENHLDLHERAATTSAGHAPPGVHPARTEVDKTRAGITPLY